MGTVESVSVDLRVPLLRLPRGALSIHRGASNSNLGGGNSAGTGFASADGVVI